MSDALERRWSGRGFNLFMTLLLLCCSVMESAVAPAVPFNVYGYVKDENGTPLVGASVVIVSSADQGFNLTDLQGRYWVTLQVNSPSDQVHVTATYHSIRTGSSGPEDTTGRSSVRIDVTVPRVTTSISCSASPATIAIGGGITVSGSISPVVSGIIVTLTYSPPNGSPFVRNTMASSGGSYTDNYVPDQLGTYLVQASWNGNVDYKGSTSSKASFIVTKKSSSISISIYPNTITSRENIDMSGTLSPALQGVSIAVEYAPSGGFWTSITTVNTGPAGTFSYSWVNPPSQGGNYSIRVSWVGNSEYEGSSRSVSFSVIKPDFLLDLEKDILSLTVANLVVDLGSLIPALASAAPVLQWGVAQTIAQALFALMVLTSVIQAFIFSFLPILYFGAAVGWGEDESH